MNLYEFEGKQLFEKYGIAVPRGCVVRRGDDAAHAYQELDVKDVVVKSQVLSGKRGNSVRIVAPERGVKKNWKLPRNTMCPLYMIRAQNSRYWYIARAGEWI